MQQRLDDLESRTRNLTVERQYRPLENPDFEADDDQAGIPGWEFLSGAGVAEPSLDAAEPFRGERCLRLMSDGPTIAIQSHLFPIPFTGQLTVSFRARGSLPAASNSQLRLFVEDAARDPSYRRYAVVRDRRQGGELGDQWEQPIVRTFDDLPRGRGNRLRIRLELTGPGDVRVDDMQLYDLRFDEQQRLGLAKLWYVADVHLKEGKLVDCLSVLEGYWPRFLIEHVALDNRQLQRVAAHQRRPAAVQKAPNTPVPKENPGIIGRFRKMLPEFMQF